MFSCLGAAFGEKPKANEVSNVIQKLHTNIKTLHLQSLHYDAQIEEQVVVLSSISRDDDPERYESEYALLESYKDTRTLLIDVLGKTRIVHEEIKKASILNEVGQTVQQESKVLGDIINENLSLDKVERIMATLELQMEKSRKAKRALAAPILPVPPLGRTKHPSVAPSVAPLGATEYQKQTLSPKGDEEDLPSVPRRSLKSDGRGDIRNPLEDPLLY